METLIGTAQPTTTAASTTATTGTPAAAAGPCTVLGSDVLYSSEHFDDVLATAHSLLSSCPQQSVFWTTYHERSAGRTLRPLLLKWGLQAHTVPLDSFCPQYCLDRPQYSSIVMIVIQFAQQQQKATGASSSAAEIAAAAAAV
jgi:hypothetical protein